MKHVNNHSLQWLSLHEQHVGIRWKPINSQSRVHAKTRPFVELLTFFSDTEELYQEQLFATKICITTFCWCWNTIISILWYVSYLYVHMFVYPILWYIQWMADLTPQYNAIYLDILRYCKCDLLRHIAIKCDILSQNIAKIKSDARQHLFAFFHVSTYCVLCK